MASCKICNKEIEPTAGRGRPRTTCPDCVAPASQSKAKRGKQAAATLNSKRHRSLLRSIEPLLVAAYLATECSDEDALRRAAVPEKRWAEVLAKAKTDPEGLLNGGIDALTNLVHGTMLAALLELRSKLPLVPPGQLGATLRALAEIAKDLGGGLTPSAGTFILEIPDPRKALEP